MVSDQYSGEPLSKLTCRQQKGSLACKVVCKILQEGNWSKDGIAHAGTLGHLHQVFLHMVFAYEVRDVGWS